MLSLKKGRNITTLGLYWDPSVNPSIQKISLVYNKLPVSVNKMGTNRGYIIKLFIDENQPGIIIMGIRTLRETLPVAVRDHRFIVSTKVFRRRRLS